MLDRLAGAAHTRDAARVENQMPFARLCVGDSLGHNFVAFCAAADEKIQNYQSTKALRQEYEFRDRRDRFNDFRGSATLPLQEVGAAFQEDPFQVTAR